MNVQQESLSFPQSVKADLHLHSRESDGRYTPSQLVKLASNNGLQLISLIDHDTTSGVAEAREEARRQGCFFIDGVEVEATLKDDTGEDHEVHILGYNVDPSSQQLQDNLELIRSHRIERTKEIHKRLRSLGIDTSYKSIRQKARGQTVSRVHIAQVLKEDRYVASIEEAFSRYLAYGKEAFVPRSGPNSKTLIKSIHDAGGKAVWAHPYYSKNDQHIELLVENGLDGLECKHSNFSEETEKHYEELARRHDLFISGGSDYHGTLDEEFTLGEWWFEIKSLPLKLSVGPEQVPTPVPENS